MISLLCLIATSRQDAWISGLPAAGTNSFYVGNKAPLKPSLLVKLPIGSIQPQGWLHVQLADEANGETGRLEEISPWLDKKNNAWISPKGEGDHGWEEVPYWLKGFGDLGYVLNDRRIIDHAKSWIEGVLSSQRADGYFGPRSNLLSNNGKPDVWPNMPMLFAMQSYYEWSKDPRILTFMGRYFHWQVTVPDDSFYLSYWEKQRGGDNMASVYWLYNRTGDASLLDLVKKIHRRTGDWVGGVPDWHGVNFAQGFREPEEYAQFDASIPGIESTEADYQKMRELYGQVPGGMYGADENARLGFHDPRQGTETCAMVEMMLSDEMLLTDDGDPKWADRCEDVAFNSLPASLTADESALHYLTAPNMIEADARSKAPGFQNGGPMLLFNPYDQRCCQHNSSHGWPYLAEHLWLGTGGNGLAAAIYAPSTVQAKVGDGSIVKIVEQTGYPFRDTITLKIQASSPVKFPLSVRVPGWTTGATVSVNGQVSQLPPGPCFSGLERTWKGGDTVVLKFPMELKLHEWVQNGNAISVERGPLSYGLQIGEKMVKSMGTKEFPATEKFPAWEIHPTSAWNYGLVPEIGKFKVTEKLFNDDKQPFALDNVPVEILAPARQIPQWQEDYTGLCATLQTSPALTTSPETLVKLVPMAAARLRISEFPTVSTDASATRWVAPLRPQTPIPTASSHTFEGDTTDALSDGLVPKNSHDSTIPRFTWWDRKGSIEWVEYDFTKARSLSSSAVYWFDDQVTGGMCRVPASWKLQAFVHGAWTDVSANGAYGVADDSFNSVEFFKVTASKFRLVAQLQPGFSSGILEWKVG